MRMGPHLESISDIRTFTTRSFPCSYSQGFGRCPNLSSHFEILSLWASGQVSTYLLQRLHIAAGEGNSNPVNYQLWLHRGLSVSSKAMTVAVGLPAGWFLGESKQ